jgi:hypothetical protein
MNIQKEIQTLIQQKMTRKEFLRQVGVIMLAIVGVGSFINYLNQDAMKPQGTARSYGRNSFGGKGLKTVKFK